jgi:hypothetical protein
MHFLEPYRPDRPSSQQRLDGCPGLVHSAWMGTIRILWAALTASQVFYAVPLLLAGPSQGADPVFTDQVRTGFRVAGALAALASILLFRSKLMPDALDRAVRDAARDGVPVAKVQAQAFVVQVICLALNESIALMGFVQALPTHDVRIMAPWLASGLVLNLLMFPRPPSGGPSRPDAQNASNG